MPKINECILYFLSQLAVSHAALGQAQPVHEAQVEPAADAQLERGRAQPEPAALEAVRFAGRERQSGLCRRNHTIAHTFFN